MTTAQLEPDVDPEAEPEQAGNVQHWRALLALVGEATSDGRTFEAATWRELPVSFSWQIENWEGHSGSVVVGRIDRIVQRGRELWGAGIVDLDQEAGRELVRQRRMDMQRGVSIDAAIGDGEVTIDDDGNITISTIEIGGATVVSFPAFAAAEWELVDEPVEAATDEDVAPSTDDAAPATEVVTAAGDVWRPPAAWFVDPGFKGRTGLHVEETGRVYGHLYGWGECHMGSPPGQCVYVPQGGDYSYITGIDGRGVITADGTHVATGPLCLSADHAGLHGVTWLQAKDHYAHSALAVADVACGEDDHGIWIAGAVRPGTDEALVHALRASAPSGDWRTVGGRLQLVAILAVNMPGFPALVASLSGGEVTALVARSTHADCGCGGTTAVQDLLVRLAALEAAVEEPKREARVLAIAEALVEMDNGPAAAGARMLAEIT